MKLENVLKSPIHHPLWLNQWILSHFLRTDFWKKIDAVIIDKRGPSVGEKKSFITRMAIFLGVYNWKYKHFLTRKYFRDLLTKKWTKTRFIIVVRIWANKNKTTSINHFFQRDPLTLEVKPNPFYKLLVSVKFITRFSYIWSYLNLICFVKWNKSCQITIQ